MAAAQRRRNINRIVAALDIGTTYSGYGYSFKDDPTKVVINANWIAGSQALISRKAPTCVLLNPAEEFVTFGYDAENQYAELAENDEHKYWYYFRHFKMKLHNDKDLTRNTTLEDATGKKLPALKIFSHSIAFLKDHLMDSLKTRHPNVNVTDVTFVLTVPAIWNDKAKRFMREAAVEAGIDNENLIIALEPEAASIWCQGVKSDIVREDSNAEFSVRQPGTQYMIVDIGGGTADITVHEKQENGTLKEIHKASGGPWGGTEVDNAFLKFLTNVVTDDVMTRFKTDEFADFIDIFRDVELRKRGITKESEQPVYIKMPQSLKECMHQSEHVSNIKEKFNGKVEWIDRNKLKVDAIILKEIMQTPLNALIAHIKLILSDPKLTGVDLILLVGGFAESKFVQDTFTKELADKKVKIPDDPGLIVLKGAALFGHNPTIVSTRVARYTYGVQVTGHFKGVHKKEQIVKTDAGDRVRSVFEKAVELGQALPLGYTVSRVGRPVNNYQHTVAHGIYKSTNKHPVLVTDNDCEKIGQIEMKLDETKAISENTYDRIFYFGDTEIRFFMRHHGTGEEIETYLEF